MERIFINTMDEIAEIMHGKILDGYKEVQFIGKYEDCIWLIRKNSLERKRDRLLNQIRQCQGNTLEEQQKLDLLLNEKMSIDLELRNRIKRTPLDD